MEKFNLIYDAVFLIGSIALVVICFFKKRRQIGKTWTGSTFDATVSIQNKELTCPHCGCNKFDKREALLNTTWVTLFRLPFLNKSGPCFVCTRCGFVQWFIDPKEKADIKVIRR